jgi:hypothetical protein
MRKESRPYLIILDKNFEIAVHMLTEKDLSRQINNAHNLLLRVYFKQYGLVNKNVWKHIVDTNNDILDKAFPNWPLKKFPLTPPKCKIQEFKFTKLCRNNFSYVLEYALALCNEYQHRYNKKHVKYIIFDWINNNFPNLPYANGHVCQYPILSIPIRFRKIDYTTSARLLYKAIVEDPMEEYLKVDIPDFFNLKDNN